jgi:hypothetical protein
MTINQDEAIARSCGCGEFDDDAAEHGGTILPARSAGRSASALMPALRRLPLRCGRGPLARSRRPTMCPSSAIKQWWEMTPEELEDAMDTFSDKEIAEIERERAADYAADDADSQMGEW